MSSIAQSDLRSRQQLSDLLETGRADVTEPEIEIAVDAASPWAWASRGHREDWSSLLPSLEFLGRRRTAGGLQRLRLHCPVDALNFHEVAALSDLAERIGCDRFRLSLSTGMPGEGSGANLSMPGHPMHLALLETLRDPRFVRRRVELNELTPLQRRAASATLPSDTLCGSADPQAWITRIEHTFADGDVTSANALAAAARWRLPFDTRVRMLEGVVLQSSGQPRAAVLRYHEVLAASPTHLPASVMLGTALSDAGEAHAAVAALQSALRIATTAAAREEINALIGAIRLP